jgi:hypothetical protein
VPSSLRRSRRYPLTREIAVSVNFRGTFLCYREAAAQMVKQGSGGRIIGTSYVAHALTLLTSRLLFSGACSVGGKQGPLQHASA